MTVGGERDIAFGHAFELLSKRFVQAEAERQRPQQLGMIDPDGDWHRHHLKQAVRLRPEAARIASAEGALNFGPAANRVGGGVDVSGNRKDFPMPVGDREQRGPELFLILEGQRPHGGRIRLRHPRFQPR